MFRVYNGKIDTQQRRFRVIGHDWLPLGGKVADFDGNCSDCLC